MNPVRNTTHDNSDRSNRSRNSNDNSNDNSNPSIRNLILITVDCLRADHLHCYNYPRNTTPFIDGLAEKGALFTSVFANGPFTAAAFPALLTSTYALDSGKYITLENRTFVSEILQKNGIKTAAIHSNPYLSSHYGYNRGFDYFEDFPGIQKPSKSILKLLQRGDSIANKLLEKVKFFYETKSIVKNCIRLREIPYVSAEGITEYALRWIDKISPAPFFLWIHYMDLHEPYVILNTGIQQVYSLNMSKLLQSKLLSNNQKHIQHIIDVYDDKLRYIDHHIKMLHVFLEKKKILKNSVLMITSDHGQEFYEHGDFGHRAKYYDETLHIPLVIYGQERMQSDSLRSQMDIPPTILSLYGITPPLDYCGSSVFSDSKKKVVISESSHNEKGIYVTGHELGATTYHLECASYACRTKEWKYIQQYDQEQLYNVKKDPKEKHNVVTEYSEVAAELRKILDEHKKKGELAEKERIFESVERLKKLKKI